MPKPASRSKTKKRRKTLATKTSGERKTAQFVIDWEITLVPERNATALELFSRTKSLRRVLLYTSEARRLGEDLAKGESKLRRGNMMRAPTGSKPK